MLTPKQLLFCEEYVKNGGNGVQAYLTAYDSNSAGAAGVESCRLLDRQDIQGKIEQLRKPLERAIIRKMVNEREYKKNLIQQRIEKCVERDDDAGVARYLEIWNKMDGEYVNINKDITERETDIKHLDNATLLKLAQAE